MMKARPAGQNPTVPPSLFGAVLGVLCTASPVQAQVAFSEGITVAEGVVLGFINRHNRLVVADLDGDGWSDLAYNTGYGEIYWCRNRGGFFGEAVQLLNRSDSMYQIRAADMDGDGSQDLVIQTQDDIIMVMKNRGDGTFLEPVAWNWKYNTYLSDFHLEDFDRDGDVDILMVQEGSQVWYSENDGSGVADEQCFYSEIHGGYFCSLNHEYALNYVNEWTDPIRQPQWAAAGDFDADGYPDVVIGSTSTFSDARSGGVDVSGNDGSGGFELNEFVTPQLQEMDVVRDGMGALVQPYDPIDIGSLKAAPLDDQPGDEVIATAWMRIPDEANPLSFALWETHEGLFYWTRPGGTLGGTGGFERRQIGPRAYGFMYHFDPADIDGDGDIDVVGLWDSQLGVMVNDGAGNFPGADGVAVDNVGPLMTMATGDLDGDGKPEIILYTTGSSNSDPEVRVYYNLTGPPTPYQSWIRTNHPELSIVDQMPGADPDGDGNDNEREFEDGTDPTDGVSFVPHLYLISGAGSVVRSPDKSEYALGDVVTLTPAAPAGHFFMGWTGALFSRESEITVTLERSISLEAHFFPDFDGPLESPGLLWRTGGAEPWEVTTSKERVGSSAIVSGAVGHGEKSWVETTVYGSGTLRFWWWVSTDFEDWGRFSVDGLERAGMAGPVNEWIHEEKYLPGDGAHVLRWAYVRDGSGSFGSNRVWLDGVEWIPDGSSYAEWAGLRGLWPDPAYAGHDGNGNGVADVFEYALDLPPEDPAAGMPKLVTASGEAPGLRFSLPTGETPDRILRVKASSSLRPGSWTTIATKEGEEAWSGSATVEEELQPDGSTRVTVRSFWGLDVVPRLFLTLEAGVGN